MVFINVDDEETAATADATKGGNDAIGVVTVVAETTLG
jgi:hypothetical protein